MNIAGVDYSMTSPGICVHSGEKWSIENCKLFYLTKTKMLEGKFCSGLICGKLLKDFKTNMERFDYISDWAVKRIGVVDRVVIEGYAYAATGRVFDIGELTGILKHKLYNSSTKTDTATPTQIKKFATGSGAATKEHMYDAWYKETGVDLMQEMTPRRSSVSSPVSDVVDAYFICKWNFFNLAAS